MPSPDDVRSVELAVHRALNKALVAPTQSEPQLVANLVFLLPHYLNRVLSSITVSGVFVHNHPHVQPHSALPDPTPPTFEIGDLLLIRSTVQSDESVTDRRAMLLQAKKVSSLPVIPGHRNQHFLYSHWPSYEYTVPKPLTGQQRWVSGPDLYYGARYLLFLDHVSGLVEHWAYLWNCPCDVLTAAPTEPTLSHYSCFATEFAAFIFGTAGKEYRFPPASGSRDWDQVIHDLVGVTAKASSEYISRVAQGNSRRGQGPLFLCGEFLQHSLLNLSGASDFSIRAQRATEVYSEPPDVPDRESGDGDSDGPHGISIIEIVETIRD